MAMRAPELSITAWLDPALEYFAKQAGVPIEDVASTVGGIGEGLALNALTDVFTKSWINRLVKLASGGLALGYAGFGKGVPVRLRKDLMALGMTMAGTAVLGDVTELKKDAEAFLDAIKKIAKGEWSKGLATGLASPGEIAAKLGLTPKVEIPSSGSASPPSVTPPPEEKKAVEVAEVY